MKKIVLIISNLIIGTSLFAQLSVGFTVGSNFCTMAGTTNNSSVAPPEQDKKGIAYGLVIGIPLEIKLSNKFGLYTAFTYHQKGFTFDDNTTDGSVNFGINGTTKINYLELPIQSKFYLIRKTLNVFILLGPSFGYAISARSKGDMTSYDATLGLTSSSFDEKLKAKDFHDAGINRFDLSIALGGGLSYKIWKGNLFFNVNYNYGVTNMQNNDIDVNKGIKEYNRGVSAMFGYLIPLTK